MQMNILYFLKCFKIDMFYNVEQITKQMYVKAKYKNKNYKVYVMNLYN